ncbi:MAG: hypothetical protein ACQESR_14225 [Planctomycetota bacterium]
MMMASIFRVVARRPRWAGAWLEMSDDGLPGPSGRRFRRPGKGAAWHNPKSGRGEILEYLKHAVTVVNKTWFSLQILSRAAGSRGVLVAFKGTEKWRVLIGDNSSVVR